MIMEQNKNITNVNNLDEFVPELITDFETEQEAQDYYAKIISKNKKDYPFWYRLKKRQQKHSFFVKFTYENNELWK